MPTNTTNLIERRIMILRNGSPYLTKAAAIAEIKTSAFLSSPGNKAEGLTDGEPILARYWAYFTRTTEGGEAKFTEQFPTTQTDANNYTFIRELDEASSDGNYRVIRVLFGVTTTYYDSSSQLTRQLEIFDNKDSVDERFAELESEIESIAINLAQADATGTDATLISTLTLDDDGRTLHKTIAKIVGSNSVNVTTTVDTTGTDTKNIAISLKLKSTGGMAEDSDGLYVKLTGTDNGLTTGSDGLKVNPDGTTIGINSSNQVYVKHGTTLEEGTSGLDVKFDNTTIVQNSSNQLSVNYDNKTMSYTSTDHLGVKSDGQTIKVDNTNGLYVNIDNDSLIYNSGSDRIEVNYDDDTIVMGTNGLKVDYDATTMTDSANGLGVKVDGETIVVDSTNGLKVPIDGATIRVVNNQIQVKYDDNTIKYTGTDGLYVNAQTNGAIDTTNGIGVKVSGNYGLEIPSSGTDANMIHIKVDGTTVGFNTNGELEVIDALITDNFLEGQGIVLEKDTVNNTVKIIADVYHGNNTSTASVVDILRFVDGSSSGTDNQVIAAKFGLTKITTGLDTNVREAYQLVDANGTGFGDQIKIYKDSSLVKVTMGHTPDQLVAAWENGNTIRYTTQGTNVEPTSGSNTLTVYSDAACTTSVGVGTIADEDGTLVLTMNTTEYTPSENNFTTKSGTGTQDDALVFIYRLADGTYSLVTINLESYLAENEFDPHSFSVSDEHIIFMKFKSSGGLETGTGNDNDGLRIKLASGSGLTTTANGLALAAATSTDLGGIKLFGSSESTGTDNYRVQLDSNNKAYVNLSNFAFHHGLTVTSDGTTVLDAWNPSADGSIAITSDNFIKLTSAAGTIAIGLNTSTDIANTTSTDALITVPTTQAVINYIETASVIGDYTNPVYNTSTENPSVMDPTILNNVVYGANSSTDADSVTEAVNKIDNKLAAVFNALLDYEALNASALESIRVNAGLGESYIYNPYANSIIEDAASLWEADKILADRLLEVGTDIYNMQLEINSMGTDIYNLQVSVTQMGTDITNLEHAVDSMGTDIARMGTDITNLENAVDSMGTDIARMGTDIENLKDNKLDEILGGNGIIVGAKTQTSTDVYKQTVEIDLAANMYTEGGAEIANTPSNLQFYGSSTDGMKKLVMTNVWDCGVY